MYSGGTCKNRPPLTYQSFLTCCLVSIYPEYPLTTGSNGQALACLHGNLTPPRFSPSRPHCVNCDWAEVSLYPLSVIACCVLPCTQLSHARQLVRLRDDNGNVSVRGVLNFQRTVVSQKKETSERNYSPHLFPHSEAKMQPLF